MRFSANLGFLWNDISLPDAIHAAKEAGFDAVEMHWPYETPALNVRAALEETGLPLLGLNTRRGNVAAGDNGLSAIPGREDDARAAIVEALAYADIVGARAIHVMAGFAQGDDAHRCFVDMLSFACENAAKIGKTILIEPLNRHDAPGYFLSNTEQARGVIESVGADNLKLMFDCYHVGRTEGDVTTRLADLLEIIGHIQFASVPDRGAPDHGEIDYSFVFKATRDLGWQTPLGAEYKVLGSTDATLGWKSNL